jgi:hypothetical protein
VSSSPEPRGLLTRIVSGSLLLLVAVVALSIALDLLSRIWVWLLLIAVAGSVVTFVIWLRRRRDRW